jgi:hypothetical protein
MYYSGAGNTGCDSYCVGMAWSVGGIDGPWVREYPKGKTSKVNRIITVLVFIVSTVCG